MSGTLVLAAQGARVIGWMTQRLNTFSDVLALEVVKPSCRAQRVQELAVHRVFNEKDSGTPGHRSSPGHM